MPYDIAWVSGLLGQQEGPTLEFKAGAALSRTGGALAELVKDVTGLANAGGGVLVYGVSEGKDPAGINVATALDPVRDPTTTADWIAQVVHSNTGPSFRGFTVTEIDASDDVGPGRVVVIAVEQAVTAHQSHRSAQYFQRVGSTTQPMLDFQVRDVMSRRSSHRVAVRFERWYPIPPTERLHHYTIAPSLENEGAVSLEHWQFELWLPRLAFDEAAIAREDLGSVHRDEADLDGVRYLRAQIPSFHRGVEHRIHPGQTLKLGHGRGYPHWHLNVNEMNQRQIREQRAPIRWKLFAPNSLATEGSFEFARWCEY